MNIKETLQGERSKETWEKVARYVGSSSERFGDLLDVFLSDDPKMNVWAGQTVSYCADRYPIIVIPYYKRLLTHLQKPKLHAAVKRNVVRILQEADLPEDLLGLAAELCFTYLDDPKETIAVRVFSMSVCYNICVKEPELAPELKAILEDHIPHGSTGFKNRGKKILKKLNHLMA